MDHLIRSAFFIAVLLAVCVYGNQGLEAKEMQKMWDLRTLSQRPNTYPVPDLAPQGVKAWGYEGILSTPELREADAKNDRIRSILYDGLPYQGKPTRVFAFYGVPNVPKGQKVPGIVLVHGGGGTSFESWVRLWNARGYAAIAMDLGGCMPTGGYGAWTRHEWAGPVMSGLANIDWPEHDQWIYHAVADIVLANSLLRSMPEVDPNRVGITGISWGGHMTCLAASVDKRFKFAAPVYGCGFLGDNSAWLPELDAMGKENAAKWVKLWDPSSYLDQSRTPMLWVTGTNDFAYPMDSLQKSYRLARGPRALCLRVNMGHGHGGLGETPEEIHAFADSLCKHGTPAPQVTGQGQIGNVVWAKYNKRSKVVKAELNFTSDSGKWQERHWTTIPCKLADSSEVTATLPEGAKVYYLNLIDDRGLIGSTEHVELP